jgi:hypothetical protein
MEETKGIDWNKEEKELKSKGETYWKQTPGTHQIVFLNNGEPKLGKDFDGKDCEKVQFLISVNKQQYQWDVTRSKTKNSLYGQIAIFASKKGGLAGQAIYLNVTGTKKETRYALIDPTTLPAQIVGGQ